MIQGYPGLSGGVFLLKSAYLPNANFFPHTSSTTMRTLFVCVLIALSQSVFVYGASANTANPSLQDLAIAPTWHFGMESAMPSKPTINPSMGEFKLNLKGGHLTGEMKYEYNGSLGFQKAGAKGYFRNQQFVVALSHPDGPLILKGKFTDANKIEGKATMNGKPYAKFHMQSKSRVDGKDPTIYCLQTEPSCAPGSSTKLVLDKMSGNLIGSSSTMVPLKDGTHWFKGGAIGKMEPHRVRLKYLDARGDVCTLDGDWDTLEQAYIGVFSSPVAEGSFAMYRDDGTRHFIDPSTENDWRMEFNPPWQGARVHITPSISFERVKGTDRITGSGSYRIGWCGNERPTRVTLHGTWDKSYRVEFWIEGPTPLHFRGTYDRTSRNIVGFDDAGRNVTMTPVIKSAGRWR